MNWGVNFDAPLTVEAYDAVPTEVLRRAGTRIDGLHVHVARRTAAGFSGLTASRSREDFHPSGPDLGGPLMARPTGSPPPPEGFPRQELEARGLVIPAEDEAQ